MELEFRHQVIVQEEQETHQVFQQLVLLEVAEVVDKEQLELMADQVAEVHGIQVGGQQEEQEILHQLVRLKEKMEVKDMALNLHTQQPVVAVQLKQV